MAVSVHRLRCSPPLPPPPHTRRRVSDPRPSISFPFSPSSSSSSDPRSLRLFRSDHLLSPITIVPNKLRRGFAVGDGDGDGDVVGHGGDGGGGEDGNGGDRSGGGGGGGGGGGDGGEEIFRRAVWVLSRLLILRRIGTIDLADGVVAEELLRCVVAFVFWSWFDGAGLCLGLAEAIMRGTADGLMTPVGVACTAAFGAAACFVGAFAALESVAACITTLVFLVPLSLVSTVCLIAAWQL